MGEAHAFKTFNPLSRLDLLKSSSIDREHFQEIEALLILIFFSIGALSLAKHFTLSEPSPSHGEGIVCVIQLHFNTIVTAVQEQSYRIIHLCIHNHALMLAVSYQ